MTLSLIAAIANNNVIGKDNALLWNIPQDMKFFRATTSGHPVIMGRKTHLSIGRALPNRRNVVITRDTAFTSPDVEVVHSVQEALSLFKDSMDEVFVIGGADIYTQTLPFADKLYITHIDANFDGDTFFPQIDTTIWKKIAETVVEKDEENMYPLRFTTYSR